MFASKCVDDITLCAYNTCNFNMDSVTKARNGKRRVCVSIDNEIAITAQHLAKIERRSLSNFVAGLILEKAAMRQTDHVPVEVLGK